MIHNAIEYGLMQAYAEGFNILKGAAERPDQDERYDLDLADIAELWRRGSVIGSWLLDLTAKALAEDKGLERYSGVVEDSGEGRWASIRRSRRRCRPMCWRRRCSPLPVARGRRASPTSSCRRSATNSAATAS